MKKLRIYGLWFVLQIVSTMELDPSTRSINSALGEVTSTMILSPTPRVLKSSDKQTIPERFGSFDSLVGKESTNTLSLKSSDISKLRTIDTFTETRTRTQSDTYSSAVRNLYNDTQSSSVHSLYSITATEKSSRTNAQNISTELQNYNSSIIGVHLMTANATDSLVLVQYTTKHAESVKISSIHATKSSAIKEANSSIMDGSQSRITEAPSSYAASSSEISESRIQSTISSFTRSFHRLESSSEYRLPSRIQTLETSKIINTSPLTISATEKQSFNTSSVSERSIHVKSPSTFTSIQEISSSKDLVMPKTLDSAKVTSIYGGSFSSRHGNSSYLSTNSEYLFSTRHVNPSTEPTRIATRLLNTSQSSANKESASTQSYKTTYLESSSWREDVTSVSYSTASELNSIMLFNQSSYSDGRESSEKETGSESKNTSRHALPSTMIRTTPHNSTPEPNPATGMPLYILAICLPLAALLGFVLTFAYFRRSQEEHRVRYSVTVEISADKPDHEMKRMYSIVDISSGINKDFLSGSESRKGSSDLLDQLDNASVSVSPTTDQNV